jgi:hypothetical protein
LNPGYVVEQESSGSKENQALESRLLCAFSETIAGQQKH